MDIAKLTIRYPDMSGVAAKIDRLTGPAKDRLAYEVKELLDADNLVVVGERDGDGSITMVFSDDARSVFLNHGIVL